LSGDVVPRFTKLLLFLLGKPTCIRNPQKSQALQVFLHLFNADENYSSLKVLLHYAERQDLLVDIQQATKRKVSGGCFTYKQLCVALPALPVPHHALRYILHGYSMYHSITVLPRTASQSGYLAVMAMEVIRLLLHYLTVINLSLPMQVNCTCCQKNKSTLKKST